MTDLKKKCSPEEQHHILQILKNRFELNMNRHPEVQWEMIQAKLENQPAKLWVLHEMELTGGEPDLVVLDANSNDYIYFDCSMQSPEGRRSLCYDQEALVSRKQNKPVHSAIGMATEMGIEILSEDDYQKLQKLITFDTKTSSWIKTPPNIRALGGALFCDYRYDAVFVYHNGAESYYSSRGFRGYLVL